MRQKLKDEKEAQTKRRSEIPVERVLVDLWKLHSCLLFQNYKYFSHIWNVINNLFPPNKNGQIVCNLFILLTLAFFTSTDTLPPLGFIKTKALSFTAALFKIKSKHILVAVDETVFEEDHCGSGTIAKQTCPQWQKDTDDTCFWNSKRRKESKKDRVMSFMHLWGCTLPDHVLVSIECNWGNEHMSCGGWFMAVVSRKVSWCREKGFGSRRSRFNGAQLDVSLEST